MSSVCTELKFDVVVVGYGGAGAKYFAMPHSRSHRTPDWNFSAALKTRRRTDSMASAL